MIVTVSLYCFLLVFFVLSVGVVMSCTSLLPAFMKAVQVFVYGFL